MSVSEQGGLIIEDASTDTQPSSSSSPSYSSLQPAPVRQKKRCGLVLAIFVIVSLVLNGVLLTMVLFNWSPWDMDPNPDPSPRSRHSGSPVTDTVCFACGYLGLGIESNDTIYNVHRLPTGDVMCCLREHNDVNKLIKTIILDQTVHHSQNEKRIPSGLQFPNHSSTGAHLYMQPSRHFSDWRLEWYGTDSYGTAFCSGVACTKGNISVRDEGRYLVYGQITLKQSSVKRGNILICIKRFNERLKSLGSQELLFSKTTPSFKTETYFLSANLKLRKSDTLFLTVSEEYYSLLGEGHFSNFFGVLKL